MINDLPKMHLSFPLSHLINNFSIVLAEFFEGYLVLLLLSRLILYLLLSCDNLSFVLMGSVNPRIMICGFQEIVGCHKDGSEGIVPNISIHGLGAKSVADIPNDRALYILEYRLPSSLLRA